jgi:hypothetical protein
MPPPVLSTCFQACNKYVCFCLLVFLCSQWPKVLNAPLADVDPELYDIIEKEKNRQYKVG